MKEVKFRWVDRYLIHLTISEKFHIAFWLPLLIIAFLGWYLLSVSHQQQIAMQVMQLQERVETVAKFVGQQPTLTLPADLRLQPQGTRGLEQQGDRYRFTASAGQAGYIMGELDTGNLSLWQGQSATLLLISEVGLDIEKLSNHSDAVLEMSTQIATSSEEQSSVAAEITHNLDQVRHEAAQVEESASASVAGTQGLKATARELARALEGIRI